MTRIVRGADAVAQQAITFRRIAPFAKPALVNGGAGFVSIIDGKPFSVAAFVVRDGRITEMDILADPERVAELELEFLDE